MELGYLFSSQIILISSLLAIISLTESSKTAHSLKYVIEWPFIKVSGEKGSILLLFAISTIFLFLLDLASSQGKISGFKTFTKRTRKAKFQQLKNLFILFIAFICAYVFQSLTFRVNNLFGIALIALNLNSLMILAGFGIFKTWLQVIFILGNILIFTFTFVKNAEVFYSFLISQIKIKF